MNRDRRRIHAAAQRRVRFREETERSRTSESQGRWDVHVILALAILVPGTLGLAVIVLSQWMLYGQ